MRVKTSRAVYATENNPMAPFIRNLRSIFHRAPCRLFWNTAVGKKGRSTGGVVGRDNKDDNMDDEEDNGWERTDSGNAG